MDTVILRGLQFNIVVGLDAWRREKPQPVEISLAVAPGRGFSAAASKDDVSQTLDYGKLYKSLSKSLTEVPLESIERIALAIINLLPPQSLLTKIEIILSKGVLRADGGIRYVLEAHHAEDQTLTTVQTVTLQGLRCACIIGVNPHEREEKQVVVVSLEFVVTQEHPLPVVEDWEAVLEDPTGNCLPLRQYHDVVRAVVERMESSAYLTVESLATAIAQTVTVEFKHEAVCVTVEKPNAIAAIEAAGVRIYRRRSFFTEKDFWKVKHA